MPEMYVAEGGLLEVGQPSLKISKKLTFVDLNS